MSSEKQFLVTAIELYFEDADESKLKCISDFWGSRGSYDLDASMVKLTLKNPVMKKQEDLPVIAEMFDEYGQELAERAGCAYAFFNVCMYFVDESNDAMKAGQECEPIVFVAANTTEK